MDFGRVVPRRARRRGRPRTAADFHALIAAKVERTARPFRRQRRHPPHVAELVRHGLALVRSPEENTRWRDDGRAFAERWPVAADSSPSVQAENPLRAFVEARREGRGIWKWDHYLDAYHSHFARFRGREVHVLEIGVYSGGSLDLWRDYFGPRAHIYGVDIEESCKRYEGGPIRIFIGDQADRGFWRRFRAEVPEVDIVIDDGGHTPDQQAVTLEELLPHIRPGGIYVTEDVHGTSNDFSDYVGGLVQALDAVEMTTDFENPERRSVSRATGFQSLVESIHCYPFLTIVEKRQSPLAELVAPKRGTEWEPFLD